MIHQVILFNLINIILYFLYLDYSSSYPIAEATNANQSDIAYTSFESDGTGNWNNYIGIITTDPYRPQEKNIIILLRLLP